MDIISKEARSLRGQLFGKKYGPPKKKAKLNEEPKQDAAAWRDPEDEELTIDVKTNKKLRHLREDFEENKLNASDFIDRQRTHFQRSVVNDWTKESEDDKEDSDSDDDDEEDDDLDQDKKKKQKQKLETIQRSAQMTAAYDAMIANDQIAFTDIGAVNSRNVHKSVISVCQFHETGKILMIAGLDKALCLYSMEGKKNELLKKIFIRDMPIRCARFTADGQEIIMSGRRHFMYTFNLITFELHRIDQLIGRDERSWELFECSPNNLHIVFVGIRGSLVVVSQKTKKPVKTLAINQQIAKLKFNQDGNLLYILTQNGLIYVFNMITFRCVDRLNFDGIVKATAFDIEPVQNLIAIGCNSGVVSIYDMNDREKGKALKPKFEVNNLVTSIHGIQFNHDGQLMVIWSKNKKQAIRLVHVQTGKTYSNWPKDGGLAFVNKATFSPHSGYLAIGNDKGFVRLIRLHFYGML